MTLTTSEPARCLFDAFGVPAVVVLLSPSLCVAGLSGSSCSGTAAGVSRKSGSGGGATGIVLIEGDGDDSLRLADLGIPSDIVVVRAVGGRPSGVY